MVEPSRQDRIRRAQRAQAPIVPEGLEPLPGIPQSVSFADPVQVTRLPGANWAPRDSSPVDVLGDFSIAPGGTGILVLFQVPIGRRFHIAGIGFGAGDEAALGFLTWDLLQNGDAITQGYQGVQSVIGEINFLADVSINLPPNITAAIRGTASVNAVLSYQYVCRMRGWAYLDQETA